MNDFEVLLLIIIVSLISIFYDYCVRMKDCKNKNAIVISVNIIHRLIYVFLMLGWLFNDKTILTIYLVIIGIVLFHWLLNKGKCKSTQLEFDICQYPNFKNFDYLYLIFNNKIGNIIQKVLMVIFIGVTIYKLAT